MLYSGRFLIGLLVGTACIGKTYMGEITDKTNAHQGFAVLAITLGCAAMTAPMIGALLYDPYNWEVEGEYFHTEWWRMHPYWLTCCLMGGIYFICILLTFFFLPETRKQPTEGSNMKLDKFVKESSDGPTSSDHNYKSFDDSDSSDVVKVEEGKIIWTTDDAYIECCDAIHRVIPRGARHKPTFHCIILFACNAGMSIAYDTMYPLLLEIGLGLSATEVGTFVSFYGASTIAYSGLVGSISVCLLHIYVYVRSTCIWPRPLAPNA